MLFRMHDGNMVAELDLDRYDLSAEELQSRTAIDVGSFVRISPHSGEPQRGQTIGQLLRGGRTCRVEILDWATGRVVLQQIPSRSSRYVLHHSLAVSRNRCGIMPRSTSPLATSLRAESMTG